MKFVSQYVLGSVVLASTMMPTMAKPESIRKLLESGRKLDEGEEGILEVEDELMNYSVNLLRCEQDATVGYDDNGYAEYGVAIVRVCPRDSCNNRAQGGCSSGYADLAVPLSTYITAFMEDQEDNMNWEDGVVEAGNVASCTQYEPDNGDGTAYYIGPACTSNAQNVRMALFTDAYCTTEASVSFASISNGWELPYSDGGLVSSQCLSCGEYNEDDGSYDLKEMCADLYEDSALKCEKWSIRHYYWDDITEVYRFGEDTTGCKRIGWMDKSPANVVSEWESIFVVLLLVVGSVAGGYYYTIWWKEQKQNLEKIDDDEDEDGDEYHQHEDEEDDESAGVSATKGTMA